MGLKVAFVGVRRKLTSLPNPLYRAKFIRYHLEAPWYYARHAPIDVHLTFPDAWGHYEEFAGAGSIGTISEFHLREERYDVVVHWRDWYPDLYVPGARNIIFCQDHTFDPAWKFRIREAQRQGALDGIMVFPTWHAENTRMELGDDIRLYENLHLGVDTETYRPSVAKDPYHLLWASDPGRGLQRLIPIFLRLWAMDHRFRLSVIWPDYAAAPIPMAHPGIKFLGNIHAGPELFDLFSRVGVVPYASTFMEPSARVHRQGQAAGSLVLYPPDMGTPSHLIEHGVTGIVEDPEMWPRLIHELVRSGQWRQIGENARRMAIREDWSVQARRFYDTFTGA